MGPFSVAPGLIEKLMFIQFKQRAFLCARALSAVSSLPHRACFCVRAAHRTAYARSVLFTCITEWGSVTLTGPTKTLGKAILHGFHMLYV